MTISTQDFLYQKYGPDIELTPLKSGTSKEIYAVTSPNNKFLVLINRHKSLARQYRAFMSNNLQKILALRGFNAPDVIDVYNIDGHPTYCHSYVEGYQIEELDSKTAYTIGRIVAEFHIAANFPRIAFPSISPRYWPCFLFKGFQNFIKRLRHRITNSLWRKLPKGICHYDLNLSNFIFSKHGVFLIDYDRHRYWPFAYELSRFIKTEDNIKCAKDFIEGYNSIRKLTADEQKFLARLIA